MVLRNTPSGQQTRRLALSLALALALHVTALSCLRAPMSPALAERKTALEVLLLPAPAPSSTDFQDGWREAALNKTAVIEPRRAVLTLPKESEPPAPVPTQESRPALGAAQLLESARRIIREETKNHPQPGTPKENEALVDNTVEARLAKALRAPRAGEKRLGDGLVKITTIFGTSYCLEVPPDRLRVGPVEPISVPMTCP